VAASFAALASVWSLSSSSTAAPNQNESDTNPSTPILALRAATSLSIEAMVEIRSFDPTMGPAIATDGKPIVGSYLHSASGNAWRTIVDVDPSRFQGLQSDMGFDGASTFTMLDHSNGIASISFAGEPSLLGPTLPNPLFELASYARPLTDANRNQIMRRKTLEQLPTASLTVPANAWQPIVVDGIRCERAILAGASFEGISYVHHVYVRQGNRSEPIRIDRVSQDGTRTISRFHFREWFVPDSGGALRFPRSIRLEEFAADGTIASELVYAIKTLRLNEPVAASAVAVDTDPAVHVWHVEANAQIR
jgi:hypothetical protein